MHGFMDLNSLVVDNSDNEDDNNDNSVTILKQV